MTAQTEKKICSHPGCSSKFTTSFKGWMIVRVETHFDTKIKHYYLYLCPKHTIKTVEKQGGLF